MRRIPSTRFCATVLATLALLGVFAFQPIGPAAAARTAQAATPAFTFGVSGGNMLGWSVNIDSDGSLVATRMSTYAPQLADPKNVINGLKTLAKTEKFTAMKTLLSCGRINPDVGSRFIIATISGQRHQVHMSGTCNKQFNQLFATLYAAAGVHLPAS